MHLPFARVWGSRIGCGLVILRLIVASVAFRRGQPLELNPIPFAILLALAELWPRALTRAELCERLWGDAVPPSDPLRSHLHLLLRRELDRDGLPALLRTVHGVGWRLDAAG